MNNTIIVGYVVLGLAFIAFCLGSVMLLRNLKPVIAWLRSSLEDPATKNASSKRLSGIWAMILVTALHVVWLKSAFIKSDFTLLPEILYADLAFVTAALGISAWQAIKFGKGENGNGGEKKEVKKDEVG